MRKNILLIVMAAAVLLFVGSANNHSKAADDPVEAIKNSKTPVHFHSLAPGNTLITNWAQVNGSQWHSLYPPTTYCHKWTCIGGIDNGNGLLSPSDRLKMQHNFSNQWLWTLVDGVTITLVLTLEPNHLDTMYVEFTGGYDSLLYPISNPLYTRWHEVLPEWCRIYEITEWIDNGDGELSICDTIELTDPKKMSSVLVSASPVYPPEMPGKGTSQICEPNSLTPIGNVPAWQPRGRPVARVNTPEGMGTGFLYSDCCLLTCGHVVEGVDAKDITVWFDFEDKTPPYLPGYNCTPDPWAVCSVTVVPPCDIAVIHIWPREGQCPGTIYPPVNLANRVPVPGEDVHVIGHPQGRCKEYSHDDYATVIMLNDPWCHDTCGCGPIGCCVSHGADTEPGSSGSPVFDSNGDVIGVHCCRGPVSPPADTCRNCFVPIEEIWDNLVWDDCPCPTSWWHVEDVAVDIMLFSTPDPAVPTLTQWGAIVLVALLISSAIFIMLRKRRRAVTHV